MACSILSIGGGAVVGPEAALGTMGTSIGSIIGRRWRINIGSSKIQAKEYVVVPPITGGGGDDDDDGNNNKNDDDDRSKENENESNNSNPSSTTTTKQTWLLPDLTTNVQSCCFDGMSVAFGQLFPAQYLSPILLIELDVNYHIFTKLNFIETVTSSGFASSISYVIFTSLKGRTFLQQLPLPIAGYEPFVLSDEIDDIGRYIGYCVILGIV